MSLFKLQDMFDFLKLIHKFKKIENILQLNNLNKHTIFIVRLIIHFDYWKICLIGSSFFFLEKLNIIMLDKSSHIVNELQNICNICCKDSCGKVFLRKSWNIYYDQYYFCYDNICVLINLLKVLRSAWKMFNLIKIKIIIRKCKCKFLIYICIYV